MEKNVSNPSKTKVTNLTSVSKNQSTNHRKSAAYDKDVRNLICGNLTSIHPDLKLFEKDGVNGLEFPIGERKVDILATQKTEEGDEELVLILVKTYPPSDLVVGEMLRNFTLVEKHVANGKNVKGIVVCEKISDDVNIALQRLGVDVFQYQLSIHAEKKAA